MKQSRLTIEDGLRALLRWMMDSGGDEPVMVGVGGGSCAGKTTVCTAIREGIAGSGVLGMDGYYRSRRLGPDPAEVNYDEPDALDLQLLKYHLKCLRAGSGFHKPVYDFRDHVRTGTKWFDPRPVVILDGVFALHSNLEGWLDFGIFVDCDDAERLRRRLLRDVAERGRSASGVIRQYDATVRPMFRQHVEATRSRADLVVWNP